MSDVLAGAAAPAAVEVPVSTERPSLHDAIAARLGGGGGPLQTAEATEAPTLEQPGGTQAQTLEGQAAAAVEDAEQAAELVDDFELDLDKDPGAPAPPAAEAAASTDEPAQAGDLTKEEADLEIGRLLQTPRGRRIYQGYKTGQELAKPEASDGTGGIGHTPTVDQTKEYFRSHVGLQRLVNDYNSGDPQQQQMVAQFLFAESKPESAEYFLRQLPDYINSTNPALLKPLVTSIGGGISHTLRQLATRSDGDNQARLIDAADILDYIQGRRTPAQPGEASANESDEVKQLRAQLQALQGNQQQQQQTATQRATTQFVSTVKQSLETQLAADAEKGLALLKGKVDDVTYQSYLNGLMTEMRGSTRGAPQAIETINNKLNDAIRRGDQSVIAQVIRDYRRIWEPKLVEGRQKYIQAAGLRLKQQSLSAAAKLQQTQNRTEPTAAGARPPDHSAPVSRRDGETSDQFRERAIQSRLGALS